MLLKPRLRIQRWTSEGDHSCTAAKNKAQRKSSLEHQEWFNACNESSTHCWCLSSAMASSFKSVGGHSGLLFVVQNAPTSFTVEGRYFPCANGRQLFLFKEDVFSLKESVGSEEDASR